MPPSERGLSRRWMLSAQARDTSGTLLDRVLNARGLDTPDARSAFLEGSLNDIPDPDSLPGCTQAADRTLQALAADEPITIYGDFDVDGITATAILWHTLKAIKPDVDLTWYIPHRLEEGYGLNTEALQTLAQQGRSLVITVDCGVTAIDAAAHAAELGLHLIITDHHTLHEGAELPVAEAIVHPGLPGHDYAFQNLAGAGVAWKLALHIARLHEGAHRLGPVLKPVLLDALALAAMGTIADVMPLVDENRRMVRVGLRHMAHCRIPGVQAMLRACTTPGSKVDVEAIGFRIGPRLNAAGRLGHAAEAVELLTTATDARADELASSLTAQNQVRRDMVTALVDEATKAAQAAGMTAPDRRIIVLAGEGDTWHRGVLGIACTRLVERFGRPVILLRRQGDTLGGSSRSVAGVSMHDALQQCDDLLNTWGGHHMAAGLELHEDALEPFTERITAWTNEQLDEADLLAGVDIDCTAIGDDLTHASIRALDALRPVGRGNEAACVVVRSAVIQQPRPMGKQGDHLDCTLDVGGTKISAVWWGGADHLDVLPEGTRVDAVAEPIIDTWRQPRPRLVIKDVRPVG